MTGASGCVGQHISRWLLDHSDAELLLWLRAPAKLTAVPADHPRIRLLVGDLRDTDRFAQELASVNRVIHAATAWGDPERAEQVNVVAVKKMLALLDPSKLEQIIYFSTASVLDRHLRPLPEALAYGTEYIQTKARCLRDLEQHRLASKVVAVFPTLVFGGRVDGTSPFTRPHEPNREPGQGALRRVVMGQPAISVNDTVKTLCRWRGVARTPGIPLWPWLIETLIRVLPIEVNDWDRFSIRQRHFIHDPVTQPERFGGCSHAPDLATVLSDSGLPNRGTPRPARKVNAST